MTGSAFIESSCGLPRSVSVTISSRSSAVVMKSTLTTAGASMEPVINGGVSFWWQQVGIPERRPALDGDLACDVCIVGGGLTGLWTAYYLAALDPTLDIVVLEAEFAGYGASGRNGGWLSAELSGSKERYAATHGRAGVQALVSSMESAVDEVIEVCRDRGHRRRHRQARRALRRAIGGPAGPYARGSAGATGHGASARATNAS